MQRSALGPYELLEPLGRGAMGQVYRARHRRSGELVALKTVDVPREGQLQGIRREIAALALLRHPGVVRILEHGVEQGLPWYAMELLQGRSLRHFAEASGEDAAAANKGRPGENPQPGAAWWTATLDTGTGLVPRPPEAPKPAGAPRRTLDRPALLGRLSLVRRLCAPLAFVHGEGFVHRDLKPDNILITERRAASRESRPEDSKRQERRRLITERHAASDERRAEDNKRPEHRWLDWPVLVDFGLVSAFRGQLSRESLSTALEAQGSVAYLAPEQARGEPVDARADLYALGCILYELLTGRPPFVGASPLQVLWQHWEVAPMAPSALVQGVPKELDDLVLKLLEKEPRQRLGYAADVAAALDRLGAGGSSEPEVPQPRSYVYRPGFHGRRSELWELQRKLEELSRGGFWRARADLRRERVGKDAPGTGALRQSPTAGHRGVARREPRRGWQRLRPGFQSRRSAASAERAAAADRGPVSRTGAPGNGAAAGPARTGAGRLRAEPARTPGAGALPPARRPASGGGKDAALPLPGRDIRDPGRGEAAASRARRPAVGRRADRGLRASALSNPSAGEVPVAAAGHVPQRGAERCSGGAAGSAGPLEAGAGAARAGGSRDDGSGHAGTGKSTAALCPTSGAALRRQSVLRRRVCTGRGGGGAAVSGRTGTLASGRAGRERASEAAYEALALPRSLLELVERRLEGLSEQALQLAEAAAVVGRETEVAVLGRMLRREEEELWEGLRELERREILLPIQAEGPAAAGKPGPERGSVRFAHDKIREVAYARLSGRRRRTQHRAAAEALEAQLGPERDEHLAALGRHWDQAGRRRKARDFYLAAARRAVRQHALEVAEQLYQAYLRLAVRPTRERIEAHIELVQDVLHIRGHLREAEVEGRQALAEARNLGASGAEANALLRLGDVAHSLGRKEEARELYQQGLALARETGDGFAEGTLLKHLASLSREQGRLEDAQSLYEEALSIQRQLGSRREEGMLLDKLGIVHSYRGLLGQAKSLHEQALAIHREVGNRREEGIALHNLAIVYQDQGLANEATELGEQALAIHRETGNRLLEAHTLRNLGTVHQDKGRLEEARTCYEQALAIQRELGHRPFEGHTLSSLGHLCFEQGRMLEARTYYARALEVLRQTGERRVEGRTLVYLAELELDAGELHSAEKRFGQALKRLHESGHRVMEAEALSGMASLQVEFGRPGDAGRLYEQALAIHRELQDPGSETSIRLKMAALTRWTGIEPARVEASAASSYAMAVEEGDLLIQGLCLCELGHVALAGGRSARQQVEEANGIAAGCALEPASPLRKGLARLERAQAAFEAGQPLFRGELVADLSDGLRRWLTETGQL